MIDLTKHTDNLKNFRKDWEKNNWSSMEYENFITLSYLFPPAPNQELFPLWIDNDGTTYCFVVKRPESDPIYGGLLHNPGSALRSTDGITATSLKNDDNYSHINPKVLEIEKGKSTWELTPRLKCLYRVLTGEEIGLSDKKAHKVLDKIHMAGHTESEWTPRGLESSQLNIWILTNKEKKTIETGKKGEWVDVTNIYDLVIKGRFVIHQNNRFAKALRYVKNNINPKAPIMKILEN